MTDLLAASRQCQSPLVILSYNVTDLIKLAIEESSVIVSKLEEIPISQSSRNKSPVVLLVLNSPLQKHETLSILTVAIFEEE